jgi:hypothetical protein
MTTLRPIRRLCVVLALPMLLVGCRDLLDIHDRPLAAEVDGGSDAQVADVMPPPPATYCTALSPPAQHCSDFDVGDVFEGWRGQGEVPYPGLNGGATLDVVARGGGRQLLAKLPALVAPTSVAQATLIFDVPVASERLSMTATITVRSENIPAGEEIILASVAFGNAGGLVLYRDLEGGVIAVVPVGKAARYPSWTAGTEHTVGFVLSLVTGATYVQGIIDGTLGPELAVPSSYAKERPRFVMGPAASAPMGAFEMSFDDVAIYWGAAQGAPP